MCLEEFDLPVFYIRSASIEEQHASSASFMYHIAWTYFKAIQNYLNLVQQIKGKHDNE